MEIQNNEEEKNEQGGALKTSANFLIILAIAIAILFFLEKAGRINLFNGEAGGKEGTTQTEKYYADLQEKYKNDTYGGSTPAETLKLFIDALKAGDTELASKYFVVEKQEELSRQLATGKQNGTLKLIISDLERSLKNGKELSPGTYQFETFDKNNIAELSFDLMLNSQTNKWKLESM